MFQSLRFKTLLGLTYVSAYDHLLDMSHIDDSYIHLGVQILTIPDISLKILQNKDLSKFLSFHNYRKNILAKVLRSN